MHNKPLHILLADDDEADRLIFKEVLEELDIKPVVYMVNNGLELLAYLTKKNAHLPHLIFLDLNMPRKNGLQCLKEIRGNEKLKAIYIAIYSTSATEKDIEETYCNGANVYITKPNNFNLLRQLLFKAIAATYLHVSASVTRKNYVLTI
jgi:CheY-like chemotaxis protein